MGRILFYLVVLVVLAGLGGAIYAIFADLPPPTRTIEIELPAVPVE